MNKLVECVPNFSEGRDEKVINAIADAMRNTPGCTLLDVDPGKSTNRTVYTFVGDPDSVIDGAINAARVAMDLIDMRNHSGEHPRMGAMDVCPFVPVAGVTMDDCAEIAKKFGERAGKELGISIYLYEEASDRDYRKKLKDIRKGEYEAMEEKMKDEKWAPDFGSRTFIPTWGCTATGARVFLVAYNVNVLGTKEQAHRIALDVREQGRGPDQPGMFKDVKGIGWYVDEYNMAQVSMNLDNFKVTAPHQVFEAISEKAAEMNLAVAGSELVGLIPLEAMLLAADYYCEKENLFLVDERQKIRLVIERLGLSSISKFVPEKGIIEYMIEEENNEPLASMSVRDFVEILGARTAAPGGGSTAALIAAMGAGLGAMVGWMTYGKRKFEDMDATMRQLIPPLHNTMEDLIPMIDADTNAFNDYMGAMGLPKNTDEEKAARTEAMQAGLKKAIMVPLKTMQLGDGCWDTMIEMAKVGNIASKSDLEVGAKSLETGIWGAHKNVMINLPGINDAAFVADITKQADEIVARAAVKMEEVFAELNKRG